MRLASSDGWMAWPAPAKLNLFLRITGQRPDGYHTLQTLYRLLNWGDTVWIRRRDDGAIARQGVSVPGLLAQDDLTIRAAQLLQQETACACGADLRLDKRIPVGGGFGGGSSNAASVLVALNALWQLDLEQSALMALGRQLGADVPIFIHGYSAWGEGIGDQLSTVELPPAAYLIIDPGIQSKTCELFQTANLTRDASLVTIEDYQTQPTLGNAFLPILRQREPLIDAALTALSAFGVPCLTGAGSGCFVAFPTRHRAEQALAQLPKTLHAWVAEGISRSPLLDTLMAYRR